MIGEGCTRMGVGVGNMEKGHMGKGSIGMEVGGMGKGSVRTRGGAQVSVQAMLGQEGLM